MFGLVSGLNKGVVKILTYFKEIDPVMYKAAREFGVDEIVKLKKEDYFSKLVRAIVGQQLSTKAATTINDRLSKLLDDRVEPEIIWKTNDELLRGVGLSRAKGVYIKDLARHYLEGLIAWERLEMMEDEVVITELIKVKGIGRWTAEMFLMFTLGRADVFSVGDLGLRRAMERIYELENPSEAQLLAMSEKWSPYRTYASMVLWRSLDKVNKTKTV